MKQTSPAWATLLPLLNFIVGLKFVLSHIKFEFLLMQKLIWSPTTTLVAELAKILTTRAA